MSVKKVAIVTPYPPIQSGVSEYAKYLSDSLVHKGIKIFIITFVEDDLPILEKDGNKVIIRVLTDSPYSILNFIKVINRIKPDVIHYNLHMTVWSKRRSLNFLYSAIPLLTRLLFRRKVIVTLHNIIEFVDKDPLRKIYSINGLTRVFGYIATWLYSRADNLVMLTKLYNNYMKKKYRAKVNYVPHGFILGKAGYLKKENGFKIGVFGFISPYKRYDIILKAYKKLKKMYPNLALKIVGGPHPDFPDIFKNLKAQIHDGIKLTGYVSSEKLPSYLEDVDVIVLPYIGWAGVSGALHFAVSLSKPIILSDIPEMRWLSKELGIKALFFKLEDTEDLINKLILIYNDSMLKRKMVEHNIKIAKKYDMKKIADIYMKLYESGVCEKCYDFS